MREIGIEMLRPILHELLGRLHPHPDYHEPAETRAYFLDSMQAAKEHGNWFVIALCRAGLGRLKNTTDNKGAAIEELTRPCIMYRDMEVTYYLYKAEEHLVGIG
jgi:hypothetical protein